jgi:hypothetical protein
LRTFSKSRYGYWYFNLTDIVGFLSFDYVLLAARPWAGEQVYEQSRSPRSTSKPEDKVNYLLVISASIVLISSCSQRNTFLEPAPTCNQWGYAVRPRRTLLHSLHGIPGTIRNYPDWTTEFENQVVDSKDTRAKAPGIESK